jgi:RNA polymerase sigma factor (sigma-70 family)
MKPWHYEIAKAQAGDLDAFTEIVREFQSMAVAYAYSILKDFHLAEDAAQEAFVDSWKSLNDLREPKAFPGWLRKIVFKHCDRFTRRKQPHLVTLDEISDMPASAPSPRQSAEQSELRDKVCAAILALPEAERLATTLCYISGYSMAEVGEFLEVPVSTVKNRLHTARGRLRERMMDMVEETFRQHAPGEDFTRAFHDSVRAGQSLAQWLGEFPVLATDHLQLRELDPEKDARDWAAVQSCPVEQATTEIKAIRDRFYSKERVFFWAVTRKGDDRMIGSVRYWEYLYHPETPWGVFGSIAATFAPEHFKSGLLSEALRAVAHYGIGKVGMVRVQCSCSLGEEDMMRELEGAGFQREGLLRSWWFDQGSQQWQDEVMYALVKGDLTA